MIDKKRDLNDYAYNFIVSNYPKVKKITSIFYIAKTKDKKFNFAPKMG
jgi:hypothetical protein